MDIVQYISTPKNTTEAAPLVTTIRLTKGRLAGGSIYFPSGPAGNLHFRARIGTLQIIPFNTGQNLRLDDAVMPLSIGFDLVGPSFDLVCETWNDSTLYAHVLTLVINLDPLPDKDLDFKALINKILLHGGRGRP